MCGFQTELFGGASGDMEEADENERTAQKTPAITQVASFSTSVLYADVCRCMCLYMHMYMYTLLYTY